MVLRDCGLGLEAFWLFRVALLFLRDARLGCFGVRGWCALMRACSSLAVGLACLTLTVGLACLSLAVGLACLSLAVGLACLSLTVGPACSLLISECAIGAWYRRGVPTDGLGLQLGSFVSKLLTFNLNSFGTVEAGLGIEGTVGTGLGID